MPFSRQDGANDISLDPVRSTSKCALRACTLRKILTPKIRVFLHCQRVVWECQICYVLMGFSTLRKQVLLLKLSSSTPIIHVELNYSGSITPNSSFIYPPMQVSLPLHGVHLPVISCSSYTVFFWVVAVPKKTVRNSAKSVVICWVPFWVYLHLDSYENRLRGK